MIFLYVYTNITQPVQGQFVHLLPDWFGHLSIDRYNFYFNLGMKDIVNTTCLVRICRKFA